MTTASHSTEPGLYSTQDMNLACYLRFRGIPLRKTIWEPNPDYDPRKEGSREHMCTWKFKADPGIEKAVELFTGGDAKVDPREYFRAVTAFKRKIYAEPGSPFRREPSSS